MWPLWSSNICRKQVNFKFQFLLLRKLVWKGDGNNPKKLLSKDNQFSFAVRFIEVRIRKGVWGWRQPGQTFLKRKTIWDFKLICLRFYVRWLPKTKWILKERLYILVARPLSHILQLYIGGNEGMEEFCIYIWPVLYLCVWGSVYRRSEAIVRCRCGKLVVVDAHNSSHPNRGGKNRKIKNYKK